MNEGQKVFIVGICGGQGGGKTKLSKVLSKNIQVRIFTECFMEPFRGVRIGRTLNLALLQPDLIWFHLLNILESLS